MKSNLYLFLSVVFLSIVLNISYFRKLPQIALPKEAQHNTIGELPIVEMADDGVFAEVDGAEEIGKQTKKDEIKGKAEREYRNCLDRIDKRCGKGSKDKYVYTTYGRGRPQRILNPSFIHRPKADKCRIESVEKCHSKLKKEADKAGYYFYATTGWFYFQAHGEASDEEYFTNTGGYMGTYVWGDKK